MCIGVYWVGLRWILTCYGFKPAQSHSIHVDYHQNEQALRPCSVIDIPGGFECIGWGLRWILTCYGLNPTQSHPTHMD
jgi:hypothetical protein